MAFHCMRPVWVVGLVVAQELPARVASSDSWYKTITPASNTNLCIDLPGGNAHNGNLLWLWECNGGDSQIWVWDNWQIRYGADENFCIDAVDMSDGVQLMLWQCNGLQQQTWGFDSDASKIYVADSSTCLDYYDSWTDSGQPLHTWDCNGYPAQEWGVWDSGAPSGGGGGDPCGSKKLGIYQIEIGSYCVHVSDRGAKGDDSHDDTDAIQAAIQEVADNGGGTVVFDAKTYKVKKLEITGNNIELHLPKNGRVKFHRKEDVQFKSQLILFAGTGDSNKRRHIAITGEGTWDGQGTTQGWWRQELKSAGGDRPHMFHATHAEYCYFEKARFINCPGHCLEMYCDHTEISGVEILSPPSNTADKTYAVEGIHGPSHNTDGVDVHGSPFYIHDSHISVGDDNVAIHANDVRIEKCWFDSGHGASIGSLGDDRKLQNITVSQVHFKDTEQGARIKTNAGAQHSWLKDVHFEDLTMEGVRKTLYIDMFYDTKKHGEYVKTDFKISDIHFERITAYGTQNYLGQEVTPGYLRCQPSCPCEDIHLVDIDHPDLDSSSGWDMCDADFSSHNVNPKSSSSPCSHPHNLVV